jgi:uncharacterized protein YjiS (DUF1127 family)
MPRRPKEIAMFRLATFRSDAAFWPLSEPGKPSLPSRPRSPLWGLLAAPARVWAAILSEVEARRAVKELSALDERMLRDIGIERGQIAHACRHGRDAIRLSDLVRWS